MSSWLPFFPQFARMNNLLALPPFPSPERALASFPDFARTLPSLVVKGAFNFEGLKSWYLHADPLHSALVVCAINVAWTGVMGELTGNVSQVDRVWSFLPVLYSLHFILYPIFSLDLPVTQTEADLDKIVPFLLQHLSHVQLLALATQLFWCARLTFNGWRRGFFNPRTEDYRWIVLRENWPKGIFGWIAWRIFNAGFIAIIQNALLLAIALPSYYLLLQSPQGLPHSSASHSVYTRKELTSFHAPTLNVAHYAIAAAAIACVVGEYIADGQQQVFQSWKHGGFKKGVPTATWKFLGGLGGKLEFDARDAQKGFISTGLWSFSRHPAFLFEQTFWWLQACFPVASLLPHFRRVALKLLEVSRWAAEEAFHHHRPSGITNTAAQLFKELPVYVFVGPLALSALFIGSTLLTEGITAPKYPLYRSAYQRRVGMFLPLESYWKRVYLSVVKGNDWRRAREVELGWHKEEAHSALKRE